MELFIYAALSRQSCRLGAAFRGCRELGDAATPQDFNILLMVETKNMAALDGFREKADPIARKIEGPPDQQLAIQTKRLEIREILGDKNMREITLK